MPKRPRRSADAPKAGATLLTQLFDRIGLAQEAHHYQVLYAWHHLAGERLGKHTRAERVRGTTLFVRVATAAWANELAYLRAELLVQLRATSGSHWIEELRFNIGPLADLPIWDLPPPPSVPAPPPPPRPVVDGGAVAEALLQIRDAELRAALAELFARACAFRPDP